MRTKRVFLMAVLAFGVLVPATANAAPPIAVGWWQRAVVEVGGLPASPPAQPPPAPPLVVVPDGGLYVANDPSGPSAVSALRFEDPAAATATVVLPVADNPVIPLGALLVACPAAGPWEAAANGAWGSRAVADCERGVQGDFREGLTTLAFELADLTPFRTTRGIELVIGPGPEETTTFAIAFDAPGDSAVFRGDDGDSSTAVSEPGTAPSRPGDNGAGSAAFAVPVPGPGDEVLALPAPSAPEAAPAPAVPRSQSPAARISIGTDGTTRALITALLIVLACGAWLVSGGAPGIRRRSTAQEAQS